MGDIRCFEFSSGAVLCFPVSLYSFTIGWILTLDGYNGRAVVLVGDSQVEQIPKQYDGVHSVGGNAKGMFEMPSIAKAWGKHDTRNGVVYRLGFQLADGVGWKCRWTWNKSRWASLDVGWKSKRKEGPCD